jgi:flavin reductase (DIM6/NTAB) family NADH-FMN oxidoreductase RutF
MKTWKRILPKDEKLASWHSYMLAAVGPRPIAFVSTIDANGRPNLSPFSFFNAFGSNPPTLIFSPARRGKDNTTKHTLHNVEAVKECVINVVSYSMVDQMSLASSEFDEGINEFEKAGFTPVESDFVRPARILEAPAAFECEVTDIIYTGTEGGAGNLVVCKILALHFDNQLVMNDNRIDQIAMDLVGRMGYDFYVRANAESIFELPKPGSKHVIGFDGLPKEIRESDFLTGSELARLANVQAIPYIEEYFPLKISIDVHSSQFEIEKRRLKNLISEFQIEKAWEVLLNLIYTK